MKTLSINSFEDLLVVYESLHDCDIVELLIDINSHSPVGEIFISNSHVIDFVAYEHKGQIKVRSYLPTTIQWNKVKVIRLNRV